MKNNTKLSLSLRKVVLSALVAAPLATLPAPLWALPATGANVTSNSVATTFDSTTTPGTLSINNTSVTRLVLKWGQFGSGTSLISAGETVRWNLASPTAAVLNMVSTGATVVDGTLSSNGQVLIVNPNGITLSGTSVVNTAGLTLSTIPEAEFNFLNTGSLAYSGTAAAGAAGKVSVLTGAAMTIGSTGSVFLAGNAVDVAGTINAGTLSVTAQGGAVNLGQGGALTVGTDFVAATLTTPEVAGWGNVTIASGGGAVNLAAGSPVTVRGTNLTVNSGGANVTAPSALLVGDTNSEGRITIAAGTTGNLTLSNVAAQNNKRLNLALTSATTSITQGFTAVTNLTAPAAGDLRFLDSTINGNLTVVSSGNIARDGDVTFLNGPRNISLSTLAGPATNNFNMGRSITFTGKGDLVFTTLDVGGINSNGSINVVSRDGSITLPGITVGSLTVTAAVNITQTGVISNLTTGSPVISVNSAGNITGASGFGTQLYTAVPTVTINQTGTGGGTTTAGAIVLSLNTDNSNRVTLNTSTGITQPNPVYSTGLPTATISGGTPIAGASSGTTTLDANTGSITLTQNNNFGTIILKNAPGGVDVKDVTHNLNIGNGTNVLGATNLTVTGDLIFGGFLASASNTNRFASTVTASAANISDIINNVTIEGSSTLTATGSIALNGASDNGVGLNNRFGQINVTAAPGGVTIYETTTVNLGAITAGSLRAYSSTGDVIQSAALQTTGAVLVGAGTAAAPGNVSLNNSGNAMSGSVSILDDFTLLANTAAPGTGGDPIGTYLARNVTIANNAALTMGTLNSTAGTGITGNLDVTATSITLNQTNVAGNVTLSATGAITASNSANQIARATVTSNGAVNLRSAGALTINATLNGGASTATFRGNTLTIGSVSSANTGLVTFQSDNDGSSTINDSVAGLSIFGPVAFTSAGGVTVNRSGHSFGRVSLSTGNGRSATVIESGSLRLGTVTIDGGGSFTATSTSGDILQDTTASGVRLGNGNNGNSNSGTFSALTGNVTLNDTDNRIPRATISAATDVVLNVQRALALGNITTGGTLTVNSGTNSISQVSGTRLNVFGTVSLDARDETALLISNITLGNTGNRMGGVIARLTDVAGTGAGVGNITITENTTLNLKSIRTAGNFTATSEAGNVIDSSDSSITVPNSIIVGGTSSFSAPNGNISLGLAGSDYAVVGFTTAGNASILDGVGNLAFTSSVIGGSLDVISTPSAVTIGQSAAINVTGNVTFITNSGNIDLSNTANQLGAIRFTANNVTLAEATTLNLRAGSVATGTVQLNTGANFITSGTGGSSFTGNLTITAPTGTITPGAGSLLVVGTFTVFSNATKDLSALSKSGNLTNKDPINLGSGTYIPPGP